MLVAALETEVEDYVAARRHERDESGRALVVRHGKAKERTVVCGAGAIAVKAPRVNDKRVDDEGHRHKFTSKILPPYMRKSPKIAEVLPVLYLRGLSTGDFREALPVLLGDDAAGLSVALAPRPLLSRERATAHIANGRGTANCWSLAISRPARRMVLGEPTGLTGRWHSRKRTRAESCTVLASSTTTRAGSREKRFTSMDTCTGDG
jgi:hypothetical protein